MKSLMWFRRDLRVIDNTALLQAAKHSPQGLIGIFIITPQTWVAHHRAPCQIAFLLKNLQDLSKTLADYNIPLLIRTVPRYDGCAKLLLNIMKEQQCNTLYFNKEYEYDEQQRDNKIIDTLFQLNFFIKAYDDQTIVPPGAIVSKTLQPYQIFTPFKSRWLQYLSVKQNYLAAGKPKIQFKLSLAADLVPSHVKEFNNQFNLSAWPIGTKAAVKRLRQFVKKKVKHYAKHRDFPALSATSELSPYLTLGILSLRQCVTELLKQTSQGTLEGLLTYAGARTWLNELVWREFYKHLIYYFPWVCKKQAFKKETDQLPWSYNQRLFITWCRGQTGYPLVDAAMRCLNQTGWLSNRLRMLVAMFLAKNLLLDWRLGEAYFMEHLLDGDFAANNGGWQWAASTGTDAVPYFRIFNPITQSKKFDPQGKFIRQYCPELAYLDNKKIHQPFRYVKVKELGYPEPIVNLARSRELVVRYFNKLRQINKL